MSKGNVGHRAAWRAVAVALLRRGAGKLREARAWAFFAVQHDRQGNAGAADGCRARAAELRADAYRDAADVHILAGALGWASGAVAADAMMRRAWGQPVQVGAGVGHVGRMTDAARAEAAVTVAALAGWALAAVIAVVAR